MGSFPKFWGMVLAAALIGASGAAAQTSAPPPQDPMLRIEAGMHTAQINRIGVDAACRWMVTGSEDKTVRLWDVTGAAARLVRTLRVPIGEGDDGKIYAVALSADGRLVAAGGYDAAYTSERAVYVYLFEVASGRLIRRLGPLGNVVLHLAFSPDDRHLAATLGGGQGVRVWETAGWRLVGEDKSYGGTNSYGAAFAAAGHLFTTAFDGHLRRYGPDFKLAHKAKAQGGARPFIAVHPAGDRLAVGFADTTAVEVYDSRNLTRLFAADTAGVDNGSLSSVAWSADGERLFAGGRYDVRGDSPIRLWGQGGGGRARDVPLSQNTIMQLLPCGAGLAVGAADPAFGLLSATGEKRLWQTGVTADMRGKREDALTLSAEGGQVRFGLSVGGQAPVLFDLVMQRLTDAPSPVSGLSAADTTSLKVSDWLNNVAPKLDGTPLALQQYEWSRALAIGPDRAHFVLGTEWRLRAYDRSGKELWQKPVPGMAWGVNITGNGKLIVAAYGDGTIRWHRLDDGRELLALFVHAKDRRWVAWTPKGYYIASPGAEDLIGWHVNRGWNEAADFFPASRFRQTFSRPDIVTRILDTLDEDRAVTLANAEAKRRQDEEDLRRKLPPVVTILAPTDGSTFAAATVTVRYTMRSPSGLAVKRVRTLIDGRPVDAGTRGLERVDRPEQTLTLDVAVPPRDVILTLIAETEQAVSASAQVTLRWAAATPGPGTPAAKLATQRDHEKPKLYALLVGVSAYTNPEFRLAYAAKDARDMAAALQNQKGGLYRDVDIKLLTDRDATFEAVRGGLGWLEREVTGRDVGLVFLAGHGVTDQQQRFFFLPVGGDPERLRETAVAKTDLQDSIAGIAGKVLVFIDACHAGRGIERTRFVTRSGGAAADITLLVNELSSVENGAVMFAASTGRQLSIEDARWENGAFTKALIEGLAGKADNYKDGIITVKELDLWLSERVKELTGKRQHPVSRMPEAMPDFPIAIVR